MNKIKLVVVDEHTIGYIYPGGLVINILHGSVLRGSCYDWLQGYFYLNYGSTIRLANKTDFDNFRISHEGYFNSDIYEFALM